MLIPFTVKKSLEYELIDKNISYKIYLFCRCCESLRIRLLLSNLPVHSSKQESKRWICCQNNWNELATSVLFHLYSLDKSHSNEKIIILKFLKINLNIPGRISAISPKKKNFRRSRGCSYSPKYSLLLATLSLRSFKLDISVVVRVF